MELDPHPPVPEPLPPVEVPFDGPAVDPIPRSQSQCNGLPAEPDTKPGRKIRRT